MNKLALGTAAAVALTFASVDADARSFRRDQVPNGSDSNASCGTCHLSRSSGGPRNVFGQLVFDMYMTPQSALGDVEWGPALARLDSDGDGYTNGEELGDPDGLWSIGDDDPVFEATSPGNADLFPCGNGSIEGPEECDGGALDGATCSTEGFTGGEIACTVDCTLDTSRCTNVVCGDDMAEGAELCDGTDLRGESCASRGFDGGELACALGCFFDETDCYNAVCGDGLAQSPETCDGDDLLGATCESLGFTGGTLACTDGCALDTSACEGEPVIVCGDGIAEGEEECDGSVPDGTTCEGLGFDEGTVSCADDCTIDTIACVMWDCGNGILEGDEECDGSVPDGATCADFGFDGGGELQCFDDCTISPVDCEFAGEDTGGGDDVAEPMPDAGADVEEDTVEQDAGTDSGDDAAAPDAGGDEDTAEADASDDTGAPDTGADDEDGSGGGSDSGCAASGTAGAPWAGLLLLGLVGLRRRQR